MAAGPAGSAVNTVFPTCKSFSGTQTFTPGLPPLSSKVLVKPVATTVGTFTGCTGGGITKGTSQRQPEGQDGDELQEVFTDAAAHKPGEPLIATIKWSNGQTSTTSNVLTVTGLDRDRDQGQARSEDHGRPRQGEDLDHQRPAPPRTRDSARRWPFTKTTFKSTSIVDEVIIDTLRLCIGAPPVGWGPVASRR